MTATAPLREHQQQAGAEFMHFGPPPAEGGAEIVANFGQYQAEYAAIRQRVGIMHMPQRGVLRLTGDDRAEFLHRMITRNVKDLAGGATRRAFQLDDKGRVLADCMLHHGDEDTWLETDVLDVDALRRLLDDRLFAEDVVLEDFTPQRVKLVLHGPAALALLREVADDAQRADDMAQMAGTHHVIELQGSPVSAYRLDDAGVMGLHLLVPTDDAVRVYEALLRAAGFDPQAEASPDADYAQQRRQGLRGRPIGWEAYNTARIEAGTPIFHIDFGQDSLPAETGVIDEAVDFEKGCYIGQEIVARIRNLGHPKRILVGVKFEGDALPVAGTQVVAPQAGGQASTDDAPAPSTQVIGGITSSTLSPMLSQRPIALAVMKWGQHEPGTPVVAAAEGRFVTGAVHPLRFLGGE